MNPEAGAGISIVALSVSNSSSGSSFSTLSPIEKNISPTVASEVFFTECRDFNSFFYSCSPLHRGDFPIHESAPISNLLITIIVINYQAFSRTVLILLITMINHGFVFIDTSNVLVKFNEFIYINQTIICKKFFYSRV